MSAAAQQRSAQSSPFAHVLASSRPLSWVNTAYPFAVAYLLGEAWAVALCTFSWRFRYFAYSRRCFSICLRRRFASFSA